MPKQTVPPIPYSVHKRTLLALNVLYAQLQREQEENISLTKQVSALSASLAEAHMTKLQRNKKKYPQAYEKLKKQVGWRLANELFRNIAVRP